MSSGIYLYTSEMNFTRIGKRDATTFASVFRVDTRWTTDPDDFGWPTDLCVVGNALYFTDTFRHRVVKRRAGDFFYLTALGTQGSGEDQFNQPRGITTDGRYLFIVDYLNHRIVKRLASDLQFVAAVGTEGKGDDQFTFPYDIACDGIFIYVRENQTAPLRIIKRRCDDLTFVTSIEDTVTRLATAGDFLYTTAPHKVQKRSLSDLSIISEVGAFGSGNDEFSSPTGIVQYGDKLWIADHGNHRIMVRDAGDLSYVDKFGSYGSGEDNFDDPEGLALYHQHLEITNAAQRTDGSRVADVDYNLLVEKGRISLTYNNGTDPILHWSPVAVATNTWESITWGEHLSRFVAVASDGTHRTAHSQDGSIWTQVSAAEANAWRGIAYGNSMFVAVASDGTNRVMTSNHGASWASKAAAEAQAWSAVAFGNNTFVAIAPGVDRVMYSTDNGDTWTAVNGCGEANSWNSIAYGRGVFVAVASDGTNRVMRSTDNGATWAAITLTGGANTWESITYGSEKFVAVSSIGSNQAMYSTDEGVTWSAVPAAASNQWTCVAYGHDTFVALSSNGTDRGMYSYDAITWNSINVEVSGWAAIAYGDQQFIGVAQSETNRSMYAYSGIGSVWESIPIAEVSGDVNEVIDVGSRSIVWDVGATLPGVTSDTYQVRIHKVPTEIFVDFWSTFLHGEVYIPATVVYEMADSSVPSNMAIYISDDGMEVGTTEFDSQEFSLPAEEEKEVSTTQIFDERENGLEGWESSSPGGQYINFASIRFTGNHWMGVGMTNTSASSRSYILVLDSTWTGGYVMLGTNFVTDPFGPDYYHPICSDVAYGDDKWIVTADRGKIVYLDVGALGDPTEPDDWAWTTITYTYLLTCVRFENGYFVAAGHDSDDDSYCMFRSTDGLTWSKIALPENMFVVSLDYHLGTWVGVATNGTNRIIYSTDDGATWTAIAAPVEKGWTSIAYGNGIWVAVSTDGAMFNSVDVTDPDEWFESTTVELGTWSSVAHGDGIFIAVANDSGPTNSTSMWTTDGDLWKPVTMSPSSGRWEAVAYYNGRFASVSASETSRLSVNDEV